MQGVRQGGVLSPFLYCLFVDQLLDIHRTNERATAGRSTFYALNSVGSHFGRLHPLTSLRLYQALCLPLLLYGSELWTLTKMELLSLERVHRRILRTIQGLPIRCHSTSLTTLLGVQDIQTLVYIYNKDSSTLWSLLLIWTPMPYPGSSYVLDLPALLPRVSHANIIKFSLTSIFQDSLLYSPNPPSAQPGRLLLKSTWASLHTSLSLKNATIAMLANAPSSLNTQPPTTPLGTGLSSPV